MACKSSSESLCLVCVPSDPYLNTDAGTMSPFEHGEVFVLDDGGEVSFLHLDYIMFWV